MAGPKRITPRRSRDQEMDPFGGEDLMKGLSQAIRAKEIILPSLLERVDLLANTLGEMHQELEAAIQGRD